MKNIYVFVILIAVFTSLSAGLAPGLDMSKKKVIVKNQPIESALATPEVAAEAPIADLKSPVSANTHQKAASHKHQELAKGYAVVSGKSVNGLAAKGNVIKNLWNARKLLKQHSTQKGFIRISITIFVFLTLLFLIGMFIGTLIYLDTKLLFFIALVLLLLWVLLFLLGNLGIRKR